MTDNEAKIVRDILWYALADPEEAIEYMIEELYKHHLYRHGIE